MQLTTEVPQSCSSGGFLDSGDKLMKAENYKISKLSYIENGSNEIMERYQIHTKYETEPPHGDAIYSISIKGQKYCHFGFMVEMLLS